MITPEQAKEELRRRSMSKISPDQAKAELARRGADTQQKPIDLGGVAKQAASAAISPLMASEQNPSMKLARGYQNLKPENQRTLGYLASSTVLPEMLGAAAESAGLPLALKTLLRMGGGAGASALSDAGTGHKVSGPNMAITAGGEGVGGVLEKGSEMLKPYLPEWAEKFAKVKRPVYDMAEKYGSKFKTKFPGTAEAIDKGSGQVSKYFNDIAQKTKGARETIFNAASGKAAEKESKYAADLATHEKTVDDMRSAFKAAKLASLSARDRSYIEASEKALQDHSEQIKGLSSGLSDAAQGLEKSGKELRKASFARGINTDPVEELKGAKLGPVARGTKHQMAVHLPSRLPSDVEDLEVRLKGYLHEASGMDPKKSLVEAVRLKRAFQDLRHVQGGLNYAEKQAVNAYTNTLEKFVKDLDPEYHGLEKAYHESQVLYDRTYDKSKRIFDSLRQGEDIPIPRDMLPKIGDFKPDAVHPPEFPSAPEKPNLERPKMPPMTALEKGPYGTTPGETRDFLHSLMHPGEGSVGKAKEAVRRVSRAPGAEDAMGNIAAKDLGEKFSRGMLYPLSLGVGTGAGTALGAMGVHGKGKKSAVGVLGGTFAMAALTRAALQSPAVYRAIATNPELIRAIVTKVPWAAKIFVAGSQDENPNP